VTDQNPQEGKGRQERTPDEILEPALLQPQQSYDDRVQLRRSLWQAEKDLREQDERLLKKRQELSSQMDQDFAALNPESVAIKQIDAEREQIKDLIGRFETAIERESHEIERVEDVRRSAQDEGRKLGYEWFRHLTTLGTGSIVILGSLLNNLLSGFSEWTWLIPIIFVSLFIAVVGSLIVMYGIYSAVLSGVVRGQPAEQGEPARLRRNLSLATLPTFISFFIGILSLVAFVLKNIC
jgi:hypothetical protein